MSLNSKMTELANAVRSLSNLISPLSIDEMIKYVTLAADGQPGDGDDINAAIIEEQAALIAELRAALEDKVAGEGGGSGGILPSGYYVLPCIQFNGKEWIDTGVYCNQNTTIRLAYTRDDNTARYIYGVANSNNSASVTAYVTSTSGNWRFGSKAVSLATPNNATMVQGADINKTRVLRGGTTSALNAGNFTTEQTLVLGGGKLADGSVSLSTCFVGKIIYFSIYDGDTCVLNYIPCMNRDGVCGFWDTVAEKFVTCNPTVEGAQFTWSYL